MARTFRQKRQMHALSELNVTNLLDIAFVLLIIFMIATPLITQEQTLPVDLPIESARPQTPPTSDKFIAVTVRTDGTYLIDADGNRPISRRDLPGRLQAIAVAAAGDAKPPVIRIRADANVPYQNIITLMDELKKAKLERVSFDTRTQS